MFRPGRKKSIWGYVAITAGLIIILSMILPAGFWWFLLGASLIGVGLYLNRRC